MWCLFLAVAAGVQVESRSLLSAEPETPITKLKALNSEAAVWAKGFKKTSNDFSKSIAKSENALKKEVKTASKKVEDSIKKVGTKLDRDSKAVNAETISYINEATQVDSQVNTDANSAEGAGEALQTEMSTDSLEKSQEDTDAADDAAEDMAESFEEHTDEVGEQTEAVRDAIKEYMDEMKGMTGNFDEKVVEADSADKERFAELAEMNKETEKVAVETTTVLKKARDVTSDMGAKVTEATANFPASLEADVQSVANKVEHGTGKMIAADEKNLELLGKEIEPELKDMVKDIHGKVAELKTNTNMINRDTIMAAEEVVSDTMGQLNADSKVQEKKEFDFGAKIEHLGHVLDRSEKQGDTIEADLESQAASGVSSIKEAASNYLLLRDQMITRVKTALGGLNSATLRKLQQHEEQVNGEVAAKLKETGDAMAKGANQVSDESSTVSSELSEIGRQLDRNLNEAKKSSGTYGAMDNQLKGLEGTVLEFVGATRLEGLEQQKEYTGEVKTASDGADQSVMNIGSKARADTLLAVQAADRQLHTGVDTLKADGTTRQQQTDRALASKAREAGQEISSLDQVNKDLEVGEGQLAEGLSASEEVVNGALDDVNDRIGQVTGDVTTARDHVLSKLASTTKETADSAAGLMSAARQNVEGNLKISNEKLSDFLKNVDASENEMDKQREESYADLQGQQAKLHGSVDHGVERSDRISAEEAEESASLHGQVAGLGKEMKDAVGTDKLQLKYAVNNIKDFYTQGFTTTFDRSERTLDRLLEKSDTGIAEFLKDARAMVGKDEQEQTQYAKNAGLTLDQLQTLIGELSHDVEKTEMTQDRKNQNFVSQMDRYGADQMHMVKRARDFLLAEKEKLKESGEAIKNNMDDQIASLASKEKEDITGLSDDANAIIGAEKTREDVLDRGMHETVGEWKARGQAQYNEINNSVQNTDEALKSFQQTAVEAAGEYRGAVASLEKDRAVGGQTVEAAIQDEERAVSHNLGSELDAQVSNLAKLRGAQKGAEAEVENLKKNMKDELSFYQSSASNKASDIENKLKALEGNRVDVAAEYDIDTKGPKAQLIETGARLASVVFKAKEEINGYAEQIAEEKKQRRALAIGVHDHISKFKQDTTHVIGGTGDTLARMTQGVAKTADVMTSDMDDYVKKLKTFTEKTIDSSYDREMVDEMQKKKMKLEGAMNSLNSWKTSFKHRTVAWRMEVQRQLRHLLGELGENDDSMQSASLDAELAMTQQIRRVQHLVQQELTKMAQTSSSKINSLIGSTQTAMAHMLEAQKHNNAEAAGEISRTRSKVDAMEGATERALAELHASQSSLNDRSSTYRSDVAAVSDKFDDLYLLPRLTVSKPNLLAEEKQDHLRRTLDSIASGGTAITSSHYSSFVETEADDKELGLQLLSLQLAKENERLEQQDQMLESRATKIQDTLRRGGTFA